LTNNYVVHFFIWLWLALFEYTFFIEKFWFFFAWKFPEAEEEHRSGAFRILEKLIGLHRVLVFSMIWARVAGFNFYKSRLMYFFPVLFFGLIFLGEERKYKFWSKIEFSGSKKIVFHQKSKFWPNIPSSWKIQILTKNRDCE